MEHGYVLRFRFMIFIFFLSVIKKYLFLILTF